MRRWNKTTHHPVSWPWPNDHVYRVSLNPCRVAGRNEDGWQTNLGDTKLPPVLSAVYPIITWTQPLLCWICQGPLPSGLKKILRRCIATSLPTWQTEFLYQSGSRLCIKSWSIQLIQHLLSITHCLLLYRNVYIHLPLKQGCTADEHLHILKEVWKMMLVDPSHLLLHHKHQLDKDWAQMDSWSTTDRIKWLKEMDYALATKCSSLSSQKDATTPPMPCQLMAGLEQQSISNLSKQICQQGQSDISC